MRSLGWLVLAIVAVYGCAAAALLLRRRIGGRAGAVAGWGFVATTFACPLLIPAASSGLRAGAAFFSADVMFKLVDIFRRRSRSGWDATLRQNLWFLVPFPAFSAVDPDHKRRLRRPENPWPQVGRIVGGTAGCLLAVLVLTTLTRLGPVRSSFVLNHAAMLLTFVVAIESISRVICGLERLAGFDTTPGIRNAYLSRTVAEFWQRYNDRVHTWLYRNVFMPSGGRRSPARSILLVFLVSGLFHEVAFTVAASRLTGYQLALFAIQGPAALASGPLERLARRGGLTGRITAHGATILFLAVTSVLFFDGMSRIFPFVYSARSPLR